MYASSRYFKCERSEKKIGNFTASLYIPTTGSYRLRHWVTLCSKFTLKCIGEKYPGAIWSCCFISVPFSYSVKISGEYLKNVLPPSLRLLILDALDCSAAKILLTIRRKSQRKTKKFSRICYFELCFYQTLFWYDLSQKSILQEKKYLQIIVSN